MSRTDKDTPYHIRLREHIDAQTIHHHPEGECIPTPYRYYSSHIAHTPATLRCPRNTRTFQCRHNREYDAHQNAVDKAREEPTTTDVDNATNWGIAANPFHLTSVTPSVGEAITAMLTAGFLPDCTMQHTHTLTEGEVLVFLDVLASDGRHTTPAHVFFERTDTTGVTLAQQLRHNPLRGVGAVSETAVKMGVILFKNPAVVTVTNNPDASCSVCDKAGTCFVYVPVRKSGVHDESCSCQRRRKVQKQEDASMIRRYLRGVNGAGREVGVGLPVKVDEEVVGEVRDALAAVGCSSPPSSVLVGGSRLVGESNGFTGSTGDGVRLPVDGGVLARLARLAESEG